jgi:hypothetical protein
MVIGVGRLTASWRSDLASSLFTKQTCTNGRTSRSICRTQRLGDDSRRAATVRRAGQRNVRRKRLARSMLVAGASTELI